MYFGERLEHGQAANSAMETQSDASGEMLLAGEVTANVESLAGLAMLDELQEASARETSFTGTATAFQGLMGGQQASGRNSTPIRSPTLTSEIASPPKSWDLYQQFLVQDQQVQRMGWGAEGRASGATAEAPRHRRSSFTGAIAAPAPAPAYRSPSPKGRPPPARRSPDTVDMGPVLGAIEASIAMDSPGVQIESEVPEGRKSFVNLLPAHDAGAACLDGRSTPGFGGRRVLTFPGAAGAPERRQEQQAQAPRPPQISEEASWLTGGDSLQYSPASELAGASSLHPVPPPMREERAPLLRRLGLEARSGMPTVPEFDQEELRATEQDRDLILTKAAKAAAEVQHERRRVEELTRVVEEARREAEREEAELAEAEKQLLHHQADQLRLLQQRLARSCTVAKASAQRLELLFRAGARVAVVKVHSGPGPLSLSFQPPGEDGLLCIASPLRRRRLPGGAAFGLSDCEPLLELARQLFTKGWHEALANLPQVAVQPDRKDPLQALVAAEEVPRLIRKLDSTGILIQDQLRTLEELPKVCPEVTNVATQLHALEGTDLAFAITVTLLHVRSHRFDGPGGLVPLFSGADLEVDALKVVLELEVEAASFPQSVDLDASALKVRQVFGRSGAREVEEALRGQGKGGFTEAIAAACVVLRRC